MKKADILELLVRSVYQLWSMSLNGAPDCHQKYEKMRDVAVGDIVMELTTAALIPGHINSIGRLVEIIKGSSEFNDIYVIKRLSDGKPFRWSNCQFVRVPNGANVTRPFDREAETLRTTHATSGATACPSEH